MDKLSLFFIFLGLLGLACGGSGGAWQPTSRSAPTFDANTTSKLFLWDRTSMHTVNVHNLASGENTREVGQLAADITAVVSGEYQVAGYYVLQRQGPYFINQGGHTSPNGLWLAYEDTSHFSLRRTDGAGMLTLSRAGSWFSPVWSPDSQWLAYADLQGMWAVAMRDLSPRPLLNRAAVQPLAWSADNRQLLLRDGNALIILDIATQTERSVAGVDAAEIHGQPAWSPDGQTIYAAYGENGRSDYNVPLTRLLEIPLARLVAIATAGGRNAIRDLLPTAKDQGITRFILSPDGQAIAADHVFCSKRASGLIPLLSTWGCDQSVLAVATANGAYVTVQKSPEREMAWERPWPPVNLADLPLPPEPIPALPEVVHTPQPLSTPTPIPMPAPHEVVPFGETAVNDTWAVTLLEHRRGDAAWEVIAATPSNQFNRLPEPPPEHDYLLARISLRYVGPETESPIVWRIHFQLLDGDGQELEQRTTGALPPPLFEPNNGRLAAGETHEGWLVFLAPQGADVTLRFHRSLFEETFYLALPGE